MIPALSPPFAEQLDSDAPPGNARAGFVAVTYGVGGWYPRGVARQKESAAVFGVPHVAFTEHVHGWPTHIEQPYAFKMLAMKEAMRRSGLLRVLWMDASSWFCHDPHEAIRAAFDTRCCVLLRDGWTLGEWASTDNLRRFGLTREEAHRIPLLYANTIGIDFSSAYMANVVEHMIAFGRDGAFVDASKDHVSPTGCRDLTHWQEQCCWSFLAHRLGLPLVDVGDLLSFGAGDVPIAAQGM